MVKNQPAARLGVSDLSPYLLRPRRQQLLTKRRAGPPQLPDREDGVSGSPVLGAARSGSAGASSLRRLLDRQRRFPTQH